MKIYILLLLLLFTSCVSNNSRTEMSEISMKNSIIIKEQEIEFKKLQAENKILREDVDNLSKRIQKIKDFYELN